jgi:HNH endonuclease
MKEIPLSAGYVALVDDEDYERVSAFKWSATVSKTKNYTIVYATRMRRKGEPKGCERLHQFLLGRHVDHRDHNGLNNTRANLRVASQSQNMANRRLPVQGASKWRGVSWHKGARKWQVQAKLGAVRLSALSRDEINAAQIYNFFAHELFGEFATYNHA